MTTIHQEGYEALKEGLARMLGPAQGWSLSRTRRPALAVAAGSSHASHRDHSARHQAKDSAKAKIGKATR